MDHRVGVLLCEPVSLLSRPNGCFGTYMLLLESIGVEHTLLLWLEGLLCIRILLFISLLASSVL